MQPLDIIFSTMHLDRGNRRSAERTGLVGSTQWGQTETERSLARGLLWLARVASTE